MNKKTSKSSNFKIYTPTKSYLVGTTSIVLLFIISRVLLLNVETITVIDTLIFIIGSFITGWIIQGYHLTSSREVFPKKDSD